MVQIILKKCCGVLFPWLLSNFSLRKLNYFPSFSNLLSVKHTLKKMIGIELETSLALACLQYLFEADICLDNKSNSDD